MKRAFASILLLIYFCVSTGFVVSMHYCMNQLDAVTVGVADVEKCGKCGMHTADSDGCCREEVKVVKLQQDQQVAKLLMPSLSLALVEQPLSQHLALPFQNFVQAQVLYHPDPPLQGAQPVYLSNCVFRI
jgi:hypothetical protein